MQRGFDCPVSWGGERFVRKKESNWREYTLYVDTFSECWLRFFVSSELKKISLSCI